MTWYTRVSFFTISHTYHQADWYIYEQNQTKHDRIRNRNHHLKGNAKPADKQLLLSQLGGPWKFLWKIRTKIIHL